MCVCVCYLPPVRGFCLDYDVVVFQPLTFTTPDLGSVAYFCISYLLKPIHPLFLMSNLRPGGAIPLLPCRPIHHRVSAQYHPPTQKSPVSVPSYQKTLCLTSPHSSLLDYDSSSLLLPPPCLLNSCRRRSHSAAKLSFNVAFSCSSDSACLHHISQILPPPI